MGNTRVGQKGSTGNFNNVRKAFKKGLSVSEVSDLT